MANRRIDPVIVSVFQRRFESIAGEMALTLLRTTKSPVLNEVGDFITGLYDAEGRMLGQYEKVPILAMSVPYALQYVISYFGEEIYPGDVIFHNDVYTGGTQLVDMTVFKPIFYKDKLVAWSCCRGHIADMGGAVAGGYNPLAKDVWSEGIRIPPVKVYDKGKLRKDVWDFIFANTRFPFVADDIRAEIGGTTVGERKLQDLIERYGLDTFESHTKAMYEATERIMRKQIKAMPQGVYKGESTIHVESGNFTVRVTVTIADSDITFDFTGSSPTAPFFINQPYASASSAVWIVLFMFLGSDVPHNAGLMAPVHMIMPEGFIINPSFPAPCVFGNHMADIIFEAVTAAFAEAMPDTVCAGWNRGLSISINGIDPRTNQHFHDICFFALKGGAGAVRGVDGYNTVGVIASSGGCLAQDYEMLEFRDPIFLHENEYLQDSAGVGCSRGGLGMYSDFEVYGEAINAVTFGTHGTIEEEQAFGLFGGKKGALNKILFNFPDGTKMQAKPFGVYSLPTGTTIQKWRGGGGGVGDPYLRPVEKVLADVRNEVVSIDSARDDYGVAINGDIRHPGSLKIDWDETNRLRSSRPIVTYV